MKFKPRIDVAKYLNDCVAAKILLGPVLVLPVATTFLLAHQYLILLLHYY